MGLFGNLVRRLVSRLPVDLCSMTNDVQYMGPTPWVDYEVGSPNSGSQCVVDPYDIDLNADALWTVLDTLPSGEVDVHSDL